MVTNYTNIPKLSIIVCAFNEEEHLENCLKSLINQEYDLSDFEIIIMDNESTDSTSVIAKKIVNSYKNKVDIKYVKIKHVGLSISRNTGISIALGDIIAFVDADALIEKNWINNILLPFNINPSVSIVAGKVDNLNDNIWFSRFIYHAHFSAGIKSRSNSKIGGLTGANMAFRKEVFDITGGFFDGFASYGDETSVAIKYLNDKPEAVISFASRAVVFNEHPLNLYDWLRQRFFQGKMLFLINAHIERSNKLKLFLKALIKSLGLLSLVIILLNFVITLPLIVFFVSFLFFVIVTFARYKYILNAFNEVSKAINFKSGLASIIVCIIGSIFSDAGYFVEGVMSFSKRQINLNNSVSSIVERV
jgi:cellulose synthase/poly-beta-1,6-N-acetylglucosamine synthase-like glycosyltransferase